MILYGKWCPVALSWDSTKSYKKQIRTALGQFVPNYVTVYNSLYTWWSLNMTYTASTRCTRGLLVKRWLRMRQHAGSHSTSDIFLIFLLKLFLIFSKVIPTLYVAYSAIYDRLYFHFTSLQIVIYFGTNWSGAVPIVLCPKCSNV